MCWRCVEKRLVKASFSSFQPVFKRLRRCFRVYLPYVFEMCRPQSSKLALFLALTAAVGAPSAMVTQTPATTYTYLTARSIAHRVVGTAASAVRRPRLIGPLRQLSHLCRNTATLAASVFATTKSILPSPFRSAAAIAFASLPPVFNFPTFVKLPVPVPLNRLTAPFC